MVTTNYKIVEDKWFRYRLIFPIKNSDGSMNWFNFLTGGSWGNLAVVIAIVLLMVGLVLAYKHDVATLVECCNSACKSLIQTTPEPNFIPLNFTN